MVHVGEHRTRVRRAAGEHDPTGPDATRSHRNGSEQRLDERFARYRRTGNRRLRDELVEEHAPLAHFLASRFANRGEQRDDLVQVALVGLFKAVERFDPDRGLQFSTFATPTILGELKRHFRDRGWAVRVPRRVQELHLQLGRIVSALGQEEGRSPTPAEVAERAGVSEEAVLEAMEAGSLYRLVSLDGSVTPDDEGGELASCLGDDDPEFERIEHRSEIDELLEVLPARERRIVELRFFEGMTQSEIAERVGVSQMHVSRLLTRSLELLRTEATA
ncbi:MAG TPA: SigB/SigF/SigG family RNA polymerase sigma factor [Acidimicrobiia bacterium]|nr:SigB/SigF/SigG family RNA polymerase sigma factor [Acidimicrobiia bacterium]